MRNRWTIKYFLSFVALLAGVLAETRVVLAASAPPQQLAEVINEGAPNVIPGQYIVVFKPDTAQVSSKRSTVRRDVLDAQETVKKLGGTVGFTYTSAVVGFSAKLTPSALQAVRALPGVAYIEADQIVSLNSIQVNPPTGLDRISERLLPLDNKYTYSETGAGVNVYVLDTGIRATHTDFGGRASGAVDEVMDGNGTNDCHGHGTHVAGTIGGTTYGVAKQVILHAVRVLDCNGKGTLSGAIAGVDWVKNNAVHPAVANMSLGGGVLPTLDTAVTNSIASGVTFVIAAGNSNADACNSSPAHVPAAITVGSIDPANDTRAFDSNFGTCVKLFAPGVNILSAWNTNDTATNTISGTSMATPHVAGVAARYLETHPQATPADVWAAIHAADDVFGVTAGWAGVMNPGAGSPNELLHWGSLHDGHDDGDPHILTVDGKYYNFQGAGEFVTLRDGDGLEIQTRVTPIATTFNPGPDDYDKLATCVSVNTAVAARVGKHRVTYEPNISGVPDPTGLQLRVDGVLTTLGAQGIDLGDGGRIAKTSDAGGLEVDFPDETALFVTPGFWVNWWYLHLEVKHTRATEGIMGAMAGSWLPALRTGAPMGLMPDSLHQRYVDLNQTFADSWRVTDATSIFDYKPGTSTGTFTIPSWPPENFPCVNEPQPPVKPANLRIAEQVCRPVTGKNRHADCVFDVTVTGNLGFAKTYLASQRIEGGAGVAPTPPGKKYAVFFDLGAAVPHGTFSKAVNSGPSFNAGLEFIATSHFSAEGIFGVHHFGSKGGGDINVFQFTGGGKLFFNPGPNRVFARAGLGGYHFSPGSTNFGGYVGGGLLHEFNAHFGVEGVYTFHIVNTPGAAARFSSVQGGIRYVFP